MLVTGYHVIIVSFITIGLGGLIVSVAVIKAQVVNSLYLTKFVCCLDKQGYSASVTLCCRMTTVRKSTRKLQMKVVKRSPPAQEYTQQSGSPLDGRGTRGCNIKTCCRHTDPEVDKDEHRTVFNILLCPF